MYDTVLIAGATGLIGRTLLHLIQDDRDFREIIALTRRDIPEFNQYPRVRQEIIDFEDLERYKNKIAARSVVCTLGTTIKKAGSRENFWKVDYYLVMQIARYAVENGCENFILVSAIGAHPDSKIFYNRIKGELERDIRKIPFRSIHILRPSLLLGKRDEFRAGEMISTIILKPLQFLIPIRYRPIEAETIARTILAILKNIQPDVHFYEGARLRQE